jgi:hypothetical protein
MNSPRGDGNTTMFISGFAFSLGNEFSERRWQYSVSDSISVSDFAIRKRILRKEI